MRNLQNDSDKKTAIDSGFIIISEEEYQKSKDIPILERIKLTWK